MFAYVCLPWWADVRDIVMIKRILLAVFLVLPVVANAQNLVNVPGPYLSGTPPTGFGTQQFQFNCTNATPTAGTCSPVVQVGNLPVDQCYLQKKSQFTLTSNATAITQLVPLVSGNTIYICSVTIKPTAATVFMLVEGTGTNCGTATAAVYGGSNGTSPTTTASAGVPYSGPGDGIAVGSGLGTWIATHVAGDALCFQQTVAENVSITFEYVQSP